MPSVEAKKRKKNIRLRDEDGGAVSDEAAKRVVELRARYQKLRAWGVGEKLPAFAGTVAELGKWFGRWENSGDTAFSDIKQFFGVGSPIVSEIAGATADIVRLERAAEEYDATRKIAGGFVAKKIDMPFDIESASDEMKQGKNVVEGAAAVADFAKDAASEALHQAGQAVTVVPGWVWGLGAAVVALFALREVRKAGEVASAFLPRKKEQREQEPSQGRR